MSTLISGRLRNTLLKSNYFDNDRNLQSLFVDERIGLWRDELPQANSRAERVEATVSSLRGKYNDAQERALVLLLQVLRDRVDPNDAYYQELVELIDALRRTPDNKIKVKRSWSERIGNTLVALAAISVVILVGVGVLVWQTMMRSTPAPSELVPTPDPAQLECRRICGQAYY